MILSAMKLLIVIMNRVMNNKETKKSYSLIRVLTANQMLKKEGLRIQLKLPKVTRSVRTDKNRKRRII